MGAEESMARVLRANAWEVERMAQDVLVPEQFVGQLGLRLGISG